MTRKSGILLHISSLPGPGGVGDLGAEAHRFLDQLARAGQSTWQVLPIGPTGFGDSPYQLFSCFAGNPFFVSLQRLVDEGLLSTGELAGAPPSLARANYGAAHAYRLPLLALAAGRLVAQQGPLIGGFHRFCEQEREWLEDYALFMSLKEDRGGQPFYLWPAPLRDRQEGALREVAVRLAERLHYHRFVQWQFFRQWQDLRDHARERGVELIGDMPIFVAHDSVDVWTHRDQFLLHADGRLQVQAGVPPDYFSATGQLWGNPLYDWDRMARDGFSFWLRRVRHASRLFDCIRIDHFRGFAAHWEIPGEARDARGGRWVKAPGAQLFQALLSQLGAGPERLRFIAEDLGIITPDVEELRDRFALPGMRVLQFSFGDGDEDKVRPYSYRQNMVVYTSTHDNDTLCSWFYGGSGSTRLPQEVLREQRNVLEYLGLRGPAPHAEAEPGASEIHWALIRLALSTVAADVIIPAQDVLGLSGEARMNQPGQAEGNWGFRLLPGQLTDEALGRLRELCRIYGRLQRRAA